MGIIISDLFRKMPCDIQILHACASEIAALIDKSGIENDFADKFDTRMRLLKRYQRDCIRVSAKNFEKIKNCNECDLFGIRFKFAINLRILFTFENDNIILLLCSFAETRGKSDYKQHIKTALYRRQLFLGGKCL